MSNGKIGIITFQRSYNYGAVLQAYALQQVFSQLGVDAETLDYRPPVRDKYFFKKPPLFSSTKPLHWFCYYLLNEVLLKNKRSDRYDRFLDFFQHDMVLSGKSFRIADEIARYVEDEKIDTLVCGSDQVWNILRYGADDALFLNFGSETLRRVSYAVSIGDLNADNLNPVDRAFFHEAISKFDFLAVREENAVDLVRNLTGSIPELVLDPTLLLSTEYWTSKADDALVPSTPYILCYFIRIGPSILKWAEALSEKLGLPVYCIDRNGETLYRSKVKGIYNVGPRQFLGLVKNASFFLTTSFHGTIFSILFGIPFLVDQMNGFEKNIRASALLQSLSLEKRLIGDEVCLQDDFFEFDNTEVIHEISKRRDFSLNYLKTAIER